MRRSLNAPAALCSIAVLSAALLTSAHAAGSVEVRYVEPQRFADTGLSQIERERNLQTLEQIFRDLGAKLPTGQTLKLQVTDVDLAGRLEFSGSNPDLRVVRGGADWPRIALDYSLLQDGKVLKSGAVRLSDLNYTFGLQTTQRNQPMYYESRMVGDWFAKTFVGN